MPPPPRKPGHRRARSDGGASISHLDLGLTHIARFQDDAGARHDPTTASTPPLSRDDTSARPSASKGSLQPPPRPPPRVAGPSALETRRARHKRASSVGGSERAASALSAAARGSTSASPGDEPSSPSSPCSPPTPTRGPRRTFMPRSGSAKSFLAGMTRSSSKKDLTRDAASRPRSGSAERHSPSPARTGLSAR